jgi:hypothetical protein
MRKRTSAKKKRTVKCWVPPREKESMAAELEEFSELFRPLTNPKQRAFLAAYVRTIGLRSAMRLSGVERHDHYYWLKNDPRYRETFKEAQRMIADLIEDDMFRRAAHGHDTPVVYRGEITGWYKSYSDRLALSVLKAIRPERYHRLPDDGWSGGPTGIDIRILRPGETLADLDAADAALAALPDPKDPDDPEEKK